MNRLKQKDITFLSSSDSPQKTSQTANTYIFNIAHKKYVIDTSCGGKRIKEIKDHISDSDNLTVLCTHYHNDHIANNGKIAKKNSDIIFHNNVKNRIHYLRTNGTGQVIAMAQQMNLKGMLERFNMFTESQIKLLINLSKISRKIPLAFLFLVSFIYSRKSIGPIYTSKKKVKYLLPEKLTKIKLDSMNTPGWIIDDGLYAFETPGHSDDHLIFYNKTNKCLFAGDCLNFLNPNDIQYGRLKETNETINFLIELIINEKVDILLQGHYFPVFGNKMILEFVKGIKNKHDIIFNEIKIIIQNTMQPINFEKLLTKVKNHDNELIQKVARVSFPRSTLIFLDVYILKLLQEMGYYSNSNKEWIR